MRASALALVLVATAGHAHAEEDPPVFEGHPAVTRYTKELGLEVTPMRLDSGWAIGGGAAVAAFYSRWLSPIAGASLSPGWAGTRAHWDTRAGTRLVYPRPLFGEVFGYVLLGTSVLFTAVDGQDDTFTRAFMLMGGIGLFGNVADHVRLRFELRDHVRIYGTSDTKHMPTASLAFVLTYR
ncbi:MAG: hypothetical protein JNL79_02320 [Myxococcales bacterium]|nr:hypothetical protein [Myxococcales bacterium]